MDGHVQHDGFGRDINYLRIAVTDKCNFRCIYCMPADGVAPRAHDELLSAEEIARFVRLVAGEGIRRVRLTGGRKPQGGPAGQPSYHSAHSRHPRDSADRGHLAHHQWRPAAQAGTAAQRCWA